MVLLREKRGSENLALAMKLHILGCGDAFGSGGRNQSGYLVETNDGSFLLDCGPTTLLAMKRAGLAPQQLNAIFLSHLHGDHFGGIPFFLLEFLYQKPPDRPLTIAGPPGTQDRVWQLFSIMYGGGNLGEREWLRFQVLRPEMCKSIDGVDVLPFRVPHQKEDISLGLKITYQGKRILFSGDSAWTDSFIEHARGADLFLCECSFFNEQPGMHVNYQVLKSRLPYLECKRLVLTHLGEDMLARVRELAATAAQDGLVLEV